MSRYKVYSRNGSTVRCTLNKVEYNGSFMDERSVSASVESPTPINFEIYDYITYRGEKFELDYKPTSIKVSSSNTSGNAYSYELIFVSLKYELERCEMRDLVPYDNGIVYPTPLTIEFTGTAQKLAERIQACLDVMYSGSQKWTITVLSGSSDEEKNISISQANCWSAVSLFNTEYGLNFYISGRTITVGDAGTAIDFTFKYGKGNGLYKIERTSDTDQGIVTRLRAYGGTDNIGDNYLRDKTEWPDSVLPASMYLPNLMLPGFETTQVDYIESDTKNEYGIREGSVVYEDIYPSIVGMTNSKGERIDKIQSAETITNDAASEFWITTYDLEFEKPLGDYIVTGGIPTIYIKSGQLQGYSFEINPEKIEEQSDGGYKIYLSRNTDNGYTVPNADLNLSSGTEFVFLGISMPKAYIEAAENRLLSRAQEYLAKYGKTNYGYEIGLDEIFAAQNESIYNSLYEGKKLKVVDDDLGINEEITIQSLTITEEDGGIPTYKITLNNEVSASTLNRIQGQVSQLESTVTNGFTLLKWQTEQYYRSMGRPYALWTRDRTTMWLYIDEEKLFATLDATLASNKDVICYATEESMDDLGIPVASDYNTTGLFRAKQGGGLLYDSSDNAWYVDTDFQGGGGSIDEEQLAAYLTNNKYVTQKYLTDNGYLKLSSPLTGYEKPSGYSPVTATDTLLSAIGKLEANFGNYVDLTTSQTVGGVKTFTERILSQKDVVAYAATDDGDLGLPVAGYSTTGLVRIQQGGGIIVDSSGIISIDPDYAGGGGVSFTPGAALELTSGGVLNVLIGTTSGTVCAGNDSRLSDNRPSPYSLSWSGYSSGSYNGSSAKSFIIPNNTNQLTNGAGFIKDGNGNFTTLSGSGSSSKYLAGNGTFYTIAYSELSGTPDLSVYVTLNTTQTITAQKTFTERVWFNGAGILYAGPSSNVHLVIGTGSGNVINGYTASDSIGNIYFNYRSGSQFTRIDGNNNLQTSGDIVAYSTGSTLSDFVPVATTSTYGLVKYDGSTIGKNSSGQLYVIGGTSSGGGSVAWGDITNKPNVLSTVQTTGSGNVVTAVSYSGSTITVTKGNVSSESGSWRGDTGNSVYLTVGGVEKRITLFDGFATNVYYSYATLKIVGATVDVSLNGHTHSWSSITSKPSWIGSSKPSYSWSEITSKPTIISSIGYSNTGSSGSGKVVTKVTASGSTVYVTYGTDQTGSGSSSWDGGTVHSNIVIQRSSATLELRYSTSNYWRIYQNSGGGYYLQWQCDSGYPMSLQKSGALQIKGSLSQNSDLRIKSITGYLTSVLDDLMKMPIIRYVRTDLENAKPEIGFGAQHLLPYFPEMVVMGTDGLYSVNYSAMSAVAIAGLKELYARFRPVESKVKMLEQQIRNLQLRLDNAYREIFELKEGGTAA